MKKQLIRLLSVILVFSMSIGLFPVQVLAYYKDRDENGPLLIQDSDGNIIPVDESWETTFPYGTFAFASGELTLTEGSEDKITVYRLGGTIGRAAAYITYVPAAASIDENTITYAHAAGSNDISIRVEDALPIAKYQPVGRDPDPLESRLAITSGQIGEDFVLDISDANADSYQWYIFADETWQKVTDAVESEFILDIEEYEEYGYDFYCVYTIDGTAYRTDSLKGEVYAYPEPEALDEIPDDIDLYPPVTYTELPMDDPDEYAGYVFELVFADGEWVKDIYVSAFDSGIARSDKFGFFTIVDNEGASLYETANKLMLHIINEIPAGPSSIGFAVTEITVDKAEGSAFLKVERTGDKSATLTVDYATSDGTAISGRDYVSAEGTLVFLGDIDTQFIEIELINDKAESDDLIDFTVSLSNLLGDGEGKSEISEDAATATVSLYNTTISETGDNIATILYDAASDVIDISASVTEAKDPIAPVEIEAATGETAEEPDDIGVEVAVEHAMASNPLTRSYTYSASSNVRFSRGSGYSGWQNYAQYSGTYNWSNTTDSAILRSSLTHKGGRNSYSSFAISDMGTMYSSMYARFDWSPSEISTSGFPIYNRPDINYPYFYIEKRTYITTMGITLPGVSAIHRNDCLISKDIDGSWPNYSYRYYMSTTSGQMSWNISDNLLGVRLGVSSLYDRRAGSDASVNVKDSILQRRIFTQNEIGLVIHTANDIGAGTDKRTAPDGTAALDASTGVYDSMRPSVTLYSGGVTSNGQLYVGSTIRVALAATPAFVLSVPDSGDLEYAVYLTDNYGNIVKRGVRVSDNTYEFKMLWDGITVEDLGKKYTLNIVMTRRQTLRIDLSPSVPRLIDEETGNVLASIDPAQTGEARTAFLNSGVANITYGYSPVQNNSQDPFSTTMSTGNISKSGISYNTSTAVMQVSNRNNLQWINFNLSPEDILLYNGRMYRGDERIYLTVRDLALADMTFYYYSEEFRSAPNVMTPNIIQTGLYLDKNGNGKIDGYYDESTGYFVLEKDGSGAELDEFEFFLEPGVSYDETLFTPVEGKQYHFKAFYTMNPRSLEPPAGANESDRVQIIPAFITNITNLDKYDTLTAEQKAYSYILSGKSRAYEDNNAEMNSADYDYSSDNKFMYGALASAPSSIDLPLGGDLNPAKLNAAGTEYTWTPNYTGNLLYDFVDPDPEPIYIPESLAGPNIPIETASGINAYLGSFTGDTMFALNLQEQQVGMDGFISQRNDPANRPGITPESVVASSNSAFPDPEPQKMQNDDDKEQTDSGTDGSGNAYDEFDVDLGIKLPKIDLNATDYVQITIDGKEIGITIGIPLGGYDKSNGGWHGLKKANQSKAEDMGKIKDFLGGKGLPADNNYNKAKNGGEFKSSSFSVSFSISLAILLKYNPIDNKFMFYQAAVSFEASLEFKYEYRLTVCPIVYIYVKVGASIKITTGFRVERDPIEESTPVITNISLTKDQEFTFETDYKAFNMTFNGKVLVTSEGEKAIPNAKGGTFSSKGGTPVTFVMVKQSGNKLAQKGAITVRALEDTTITRVARVVEADSAVLWNGLILEPSVFIEAGAGIGIEFCKLELFIKLSIGCGMTFGPSNRVYDPATGTYSTKMGAFNFDSFELSLGLGVRVVLLIFSFEMDAIKYTLKYDNTSPDYAKTWTHSWSALGGAFGGDIRSRSAAVTQDNGVRIKLPGSAAYTQIIYEPAKETGGITTRAFNPNDPKAPFQLSGYGTSGDAFKLADGLITGYDYRVVTVDGDNYIVYTISRYDAENPVDNSMLVLSKIKVTSDNGVESYGLVNPVIDGAYPAYIILDDDDTGDLDFSVWTEGDVIHAAWVNYATTFPLTYPTEPEDHDQPDGMGVDNFEEISFNPATVTAPTVVVEEPTEVSNPGIMSEPDVVLQPDESDEEGYAAALMKYQQYLLDKAAYDAYDIAKTAYDQYVLDKAEYDNYINALAAYEQYLIDKAAYDAWYKYFEELTDYNVYVQNIATNSAQNTEIRTASFDTTSGTQFSPAEKISGPIGSNNYMPKGAGDGSVTFYAEAIHGDDTWLHDELEAFDYYLSIQYPTDNLEGAQLQATKNIHEFRMLYQRGIWELYGKGTKLSAAVDGDVIAVPLPERQIIDSMDVIYDYNEDNNIYYVAYITSQYASTPDGDNFVTVRRLYLRTFDGTTKEWSDAYLIRTIRDFDVNDGGNDGVYSGGNLAVSYDDPYFANLKFLNGKIGEFLRDGELIQAFSSRGVNPENFLIFEMNGTTYILPENDIKGIVGITDSEQHTGTLYPFFKPADFIDANGDPVPQTSSGRSEVTIGADGAGNISAVYVAGVPNTMNNALYLTKYDPDTGTWGTGTMLAMHNMQVYEDSFSENWTNEETELAYLGLLDGYDKTPRGDKTTGMEYFTFSNLQIALGLTAPESDTTSGGGDIGEVTSGDEADARDTLLVITQGSLTKLQEITIDSQKEIIPDGSASMGIYAISYGVGKQRIGEDKLSFFDYDFTAGSELTASLKFKNIGDVAIRGSDDGPIDVQLKVITPDPDNSTQKMAEWKIEQNIISGQEVSLLANLNALSQTLPAGSIFYIEVSEDAEYIRSTGGTPFTADTLVRDGDSNITGGTFVVEDKPELGFEDFNVSIARINENGDIVLDVEFLVGNRGTEDAEDVYVQFSYESGHDDSTGEFDYTPVNLTGHTLKVGEQEILQPLMRGGLDTNLVNGILKLTGPEGNAHIDVNYGRTVEGTIIVPASAYKTSVTGALTLKVDIYSAADVITSYVAGMVKTVDRGEYNTANNTRITAIDHETFFTTASRLILTPGNTMRLPVILSTTSGTSAPVIIAEEIITPGEPKNIGVLNFIPGVYSKGHMTGALIIAPSVIPEDDEPIYGKIHLKDLNTNSIHIITYMIKDPGDGIDVYIDNGYFTFFNTNGNSYIGNESANHWKFTGGVQTWGTDINGVQLATNPPLNNHLATAVKGASFEFTTVAKDIDFYFNGTIQVTSDVFSGTMTLTLPDKTNGKTLFDTINFGDNLYNQPFNVKVTVMSDSAQFDKIVEHYTGGIVPLPKRDDNAPYIFWSRNFPDAASIEKGDGNKVELICYVIDDGELASVTYNGAEQLTPGDTQFVQFNVTVTENTQSISISAMDTAGNRAAQNIPIDWYNEIISGDANSEAPEFDVKFTNEKGDVLTVFVTSGKTAYLDVSTDENNTITVSSLGFSEDGDSIILTPITPTSDDASRFIIANNGFYRVDIQAADGTWAMAIVEMYLIDREVPIITLKYDKPNIEWSAKKNPPLRSSGAASQSAMISKAAINGFSVLGVSGQTVGGTLPVYFNGEYTLRVEDTLGNYNTQDIVITDMPVDLSNPDYLKIINSWNQGRNNGKIIIDPDLIAGGQYDPDKSDLSRNQYAGTYQHLLVSANEVIYLEDDTLEWLDFDEDTEYIYSDLAPGAYKLYVRNALDDVNWIENASYADIIIADEAIAFTIIITSTYSSSSDGSIKVVASGGKDSTGIYQFAILTDSGVLIPAEEMEDNGAEWVIGNISDGEPEIKLFDGLAAGSYQIGVRVILGVDAEVLADLYNIKATAAERLETAEANLTESAINLAVMSYINLINSNLQIWIDSQITGENQEDGDAAIGIYMQIIEELTAGVYGDDPILDKLSDWINALFSEEDEKAIEAARNAYDEVLAYYVGEFIKNNAQAEFDSAESAFDTAKNNYDALLQSGEYIYETDTDLWLNALSVVVKVPVRTYPAPNPDPDITEPTGGDDGEDESNSVIIIKNGKKIAMPLDKDGITFRFTKSDIAEYKNDTGVFVIEIYDRTPIGLIIPISALENDSLLIITSFGKLYISSDTLQAIRKKFGNNLWLVLEKSSFKVTLLNSNKEEIVYNDPIYPFYIILPVTPAADGNANSYAGVKKELSDNIIMPYSIYKNGEIIFQTPGTGTFDIVYNDKTFADITEPKHWAAEYITFTAARNLFQGIGNDLFSPDTPMTRAMFATVLSRLDGNDLSVYTASSFTDVKSGEWYTEAIEWAADKGIINGYGDGLFGPQDEITREQMAVMLARYIEYKKSMLPEGEMISFKDQADISSWAADSVKMMQSAGIIVGRPGGIYDPKGTATRAEVATIFARFIDIYINNSVDRTAEVQTIINSNTTLEAYIDKSVIEAIERALTPSDNSEKPDNMS